MSMTYSTNQFRAGLKVTLDNDPCVVTEVEFVKPGTGRGTAAPEPHPDLAKHVLAAALERKLIVLSAGSYGNVARIIPPLVTTAEEVDLALSILEDSVNAAGA